MSTDEPQVPLGDDARNLVAPLRVVAAPVAPRPIRVTHSPVPMLDTAMFEHMQRVATIMAEGTLIPDSLCTTKEDDQVVRLPLRSIVANCFLVVNQAVRWGLDPFAAAQCASVVHGRLMWEGKLVAAVIDANLGVRLRYTFDDQPGDKLGVTVSGTIPDEREAREIKGTVALWRTSGSNSPWGNPGNFRRQLVYRGAREWARMHAPAIMLGVVTDDDQPIEPQRPGLGGDKPLSTFRAVPAAVPVLEIPDEAAPAAPAASGTGGTSEPAAYDAGDLLVQAEFLRGCEDDKMFCTSIEELEELRASRLDFRDQLSPDNQRKFDALFEVED